MRVRNEQPARRGGRNAQRHGRPPAATRASCVCSKRSARTEVRSGKSRSATGRDNGPSSASPCRSSGSSSSCSGCRSTRRSGSSLSASPTASPAWPICVSSTARWRRRRPSLCLPAARSDLPGRHPVLRSGDLRLPESVPAGRDRPHRHPLRNPDDVPLVGDDAGRVPSAPDASAFWRSNVELGLAYLVMVAFGPVFFSSLIRRVHAIRAIEEERAAAIATRELAIARSAFLAKVSHELRSPLQGIVSALDVIEMRHARAFQGDEELIGRMRRSSMLLNTQLRDLLTLAKGEAGRLQIHAEPFEACALVEAMAEDARELAVSKGLQLRVMLPPAPLFAVADGARIDQVLTNLVVNSIRYTDAGEVRVSMEPQGDPPNGLRFVVADTGPGIPEDVLPTLFEPDKFVTTPARRGEGSGIGLAIVRTLVDHLGGTPARGQRAGQGHDVHGRDPGRVRSARPGGLRRHRHPWPGPRRRRPERRARCPGKRDRRARLRARPRRLGRGRHAPALGARLRRRAARPRHADSRRRRRWWRKRGAATDRTGRRTSSASAPPSGRRRPIRTSTSAWASRSTSRPCAARCSARAAGNARPRRVSGRRTAQRRFAALRSESRASSAASRSPRLKARTSCPCRPWRRRCPGTSGRSSS